MFKILKRITILLTILLSIIWIYTSSLIGVEQEVKNQYQQLKIELKKQNYKSNMFVISGRRWKIDNYILSQLGGAASESKHKKGLAIDLIILDINNDGKSDATDVNIVYKILDKKIIKNKGGIGTYKNENGFFNRQMIHFDLRGNRARWNR